MSRPNVELYERFAFPDLVSSARKRSRPGEAAGLEGYRGVTELHSQLSGDQEVELKIFTFEAPERNKFALKLTENTPSGVRAALFPLVHCHGPTLTIDGERNLTSTRTTQSQSRAPLA